MQFIRNLLGAGPDDEILWTPIIIIVGIILIFVFFGVGFVVGIVFPAPPHIQEAVNTTPVPIERALQNDTLPETMVTLAMNGTIAPRFYGPTEVPRSVNITKVFNPYEPGTRNLSEFFIIHRDNVTGEKDLTIKTTVYGWMKAHQVKWYSDSWGYYMDQVAPKGQDYLFVYLVSYVDGDTAKEDSRAWYFGPEVFRLQVDDRLYDQTTIFTPEMRIKELETVPNFNKIRGLHAYGYTVVQTRGTGNITAEEDPWMHLGVANAKDGYLVYQIPANTDPSMMSLNGAFGSWGGAGWRLA